MPPGGVRPADAIAPSRFSLTIDGVEIAQFFELVGIISEAEPDDLAGSLLKKLPGKRTPPTVTLRRALSGDVQLWSWHEARRERQSAANKDAALIMYDATGEPVARYHLESAWVPKIEIGALKSGANEVLMETVTIACQSIRRVAA
jgi:phage tail-like protein